MACDILCIPGTLSVLYRSLFQTYIQVLLSPLKGSSQVVVTQFPSSMPVSMLTLFGFLCLLRSGCTLPGPKPVLPCIVECWAAMKVNSDSMGNNILYMTCDVMPFVFLVLSYLVHITILYLYSTSILYYWHLLLTGHLPKITEISILSSLTAKYPLHFYLLYLDRLSHSS